MCSRLFTSWLAQSGPPSCYPCCFGSMLLSTRACRACEQQSIPDTKAHEQQRGQWAHVHARPVSCAHGYLGRHPLPGSCSWRCLRIAICCRRAAACGWDCPTHASMHKPLCAQATGAWHALMLVATRRTRLLAAPQTLRAQPGPPGKSTPASSSKHSPSSKPPASHP